MTAAQKRTHVRPLPEGFEQLFREHHGLIYRAAFRITGNAEDAEDVLQTLFMKLLRRGELLDLNGNPKGYLHRAAVNIALDIVRLRRRTVLPDEAALGRGRPDRESGMLEMVESALAELSPKLAEMFVLKHVEGYGNDEIARMIGTTRGVVAVLLFRARVRLKKSIRGRLKKRE